MLTGADREQILAAAFESSLNCVIVMDEAGRVLEFNPMAQKTFGYAAAEAIGRTVSELIVPRHLRRAHLNGLARYIGGGPGRMIGRRVEVEACCKDGQVIPVEIAVSEVPASGRRLFTASLRDLSNRVDEEELEATQRTLELAGEGANFGIWTFNPTTGAIWYSDRSRELYGFAPGTVPSEATIKPIIHPDDWERLSAPYFRGFPDDRLEMEYRFFRPDGEMRWMYALGAALKDDDGRTRSVSGIHIDITERKRAEEDLARSRDALHQSEKLAALGALLAGVSHELNNPLAAIVGQAEMLEEDCRGTPLEARAQKISSAAGRCARIVQTFLAMAREQSPQRKIVSLNKMVEAALEITEYSLRTAGISVRGNFSGNLPPVEAHPGQLHQVLVNLIVNAQQAMEGGGLFEKTLTVRTSVNQSGMVLADISDTGPGVPHELRCRIFDPFFTTKPQGSGTGVGLSFSMGIVEAHGGALTLEPTLRGAVFRVALPPAGGIPDVPAARPREERPVDSSFQRVLLVEDEADVADTLCELLEREGFSVTIARDGTEAFYALDTGEFDLLFSDLRMPRLNGRELYERLCEIRPKLVARMAFVTGNTIDKSMDEFLKSCGRPIMEKPFTRAGIRATLAALTGPEQP